MAALVPVAPGLEELQPVVPPVLAEPPGGEPEEGGELPERLRPRGLRGLLTGRISTRIMLPFIIVMMLLSSGGTYVVLNIITGSLISKFQHQLLSAGQNVNAGILKIETEQLQLVRLLSNTQGVDTALADKDVPTLQQLLVPLQANSPFGFVDVLDPSGTEVLALRPRNNQYVNALDPNLGQLQVSKDALANQKDQLGDKYTELVNASYGQFLYSGGPVLDANGRVVGAILVGMPFNDLLKQITQDVVANVTVYNQTGTIFDTTLPVPSDDHSLDVDKPTLAQVFASPPRTIARPVKVGNAAYMELLGGLFIRDKASAVLGVAVPRTAIDQSSAQTRLELSIMFTTVTMAIVVIGLGMAKRISTPLSVLVQVCRVVARGEFAHKVEITTRDETGILSHSVNQMMDGLAERDRIRDTFGRYMTQQVSDAILKGDVQLGGEMRDVTIFMSDIRGFAALSQTMPAEELVAFLNSYFGVMIDCVLTHDGIVDKFMEDAILVVYGAPVRFEDHPVKAVITALEMRERLAEFNQQLVTEGYEPIRIGIGINSGPAVTGNIGSEVRMEYTVISDTVNSTQRTRELTAQFHTDILISDATAGRLDGRFILGQPQRITLRGRRQESAVYPVIGMRSLPEEEWRDRPPLLLAEAGVTLEKAS